MTRTCCREAEGRGLSRLHVETTAVTMPAISTAISRCAGRCGDRPRRSCHGHVPTQSLSPRQTLACSDPWALGKCGSGFHLLRPIDASARFARRLAKGCGNPHHEGLAEPAKRLLVRPDVPGSFGDIVIVFVDNDPQRLRSLRPARRHSISETSKAILSACGGWVVNARSARCVRAIRRARVAAPRDRDKQSPDRAGTHDSSSYLSAAPAGRSPRRRAPYAPPASRKRDGRCADRAGAHLLVVFVAHQHEAGFLVLGENHLFQICKKTALTRRFPKPARPGCQGGEPCRRGSR